MNRVLLEFNPYTQKLRIFLNEKEISVYSELKNYTYKQVIEKPAGIINAIGKELNDDFDLFVTAPQLIYTKVEQAAKENEYCNSCQSVASKVSMSIKERFEQLGNQIEVKELTALLIDSPIIPGPISYGSVTVNFTADQAVEADAELDLSSDNEITEELIIDICEVYLLYPYIGNIAGKSTDKEIFICSQINPVIEAVLPEYMEVGASVEIAFTAYPTGSELPKITLHTSNPDVIAVEGHTLKALTSGTAKLSAVVAGENEPFSVQSITASKTVLVSKVEIIEIKGPLYPGKEIELSANVYPADADDIDSLTFVSTEPDIAEVVGNKLVIKSEGTFSLRAKTTKADCAQTFNVQPKLTALSISAKTAEINVGGKMPITVSVTPETAFNKEYSWTTSDKSVALVVKEEGKEYIKAVGIGSCEITCKSADGSITDTCSVTVKSVMYANKEKKKLSKASIIGIILVFIVLFGIKPSKASKPEDMEKELGVDYANKYSDATPVDVFAGLEYSIEGINGSGKISINNTLEDEFVKNISFKVSQDYELSNGDSVVITVEVDESVIEVFNCVPVETSKTIIISGLPYIVTDIKQIPSDFINSAVEYIVDEKTKENIEYTGLGMSHGEVVLDGKYFLIDSKNNENYIAILIHSDDYLDGEYRWTEYYTYWYEDVSVSEDGTLAVNIDDYEVSHDRSLDDALYYIYEEDDGYVTVTIE